MRNVMKASTIESKFPLLAVEGGCIISKDADGISPGEALGMAAWFVADCD